MPIPFEQQWYSFRNRWLATAARRITFVLCWSLLLGGIVGTQFYRVEAKAEEFRSGALGAAETVFLPPKPVLRASALGREEFLADMLFARAQAYFVKHLFGDRIYEWLDKYLEAILFLDPDNRLVYSWAAKAVMYGQEITNDDVARSNHYNELAIQRFPNDWRFHFDVGFNLYYEWDFADDEEKARLRDVAVEHFRTAASLPNSRLDPNFITELLMRKNDTRLALLNAKMRYHEASDREKEMLERRIARLESKAAAEELRNQSEAWRKDFAFLPFGVYQFFESAADWRLPSGWRQGALR